MIHVRLLRRPWLACLLCLLLGARHALAQGAGVPWLQGLVLDSAGRPVAFATATLWDSAATKALTFALTGPDGRFQLRGLDTLPKAFRIVLEHLQMQRIDSLCRWQAEGQPHPPFLFRMCYAPRTLEEVIVRARPPAMSQRGDTLVYEAARYADGATRKVEDLLRRLPGFQVSSDGRIHVNGREVDRILIDGDDLTERNYRLLSQHLQAAMVDKVEVISAYQPDRLLAQVERSDKVGINLRMGRRHRDRLSLDLSPSFGTAGRHRSDAQSAWLTAKAKWLSSWDGNNTSSQSGMLATAASATVTADGIEEAISFAFPLQVGRMALPSLENGYVRDNRDASMLQVLSTRMGRHTHLRCIAALGRSSWQARAAETGEYKTPDAGGWLLQADRSMQETLTRQSATLVLHQDRGGKHTRYWSLEAGKHQGDALLHNRLTGALHDSARERIDNQGIAVQWKTAHTFLRRNNQVVKLQYVCARQLASQAFDVLTGRWGQAFSGSQLASYFQQGLAGTLWSQEADLRFYRRGRRMDGQLRLDLRSLAHRYEGRLQSGFPAMMMPSIREGSTFVRQQQAGVSYAFEGPLRSDWAWGGDLGLGPGMHLLQRAAGSQHATGALYHAQLHLRRAWAGSRQLGLKMGSWKELPAPELFLPEYLDGDATLRSPASAIALANRWKLELAYARHDLARARSLSAMLTAGFDRGLYVPYIERRKEHMHITRVPAERQFAGRFHLHAERYVDAMRIKWVSDGSWMGSQADGWLNGIAARVFSSQAAVDLRAVTALSGWFQVEGGGRSSWNWNGSLPTLGQAARYQLWQHQGYFRVKAEWRDKAFLAIRYARWRLSAGSSVGTLDLFGNVVAGKSLRISLTGHNLTDLGMISIRSIATNEQQYLQNSLVGRYVLLGVAWSL